ncbi:hypothetical protein [Companilactobacillus baiquanensis]|uniref:HTH cro/C1-type domain-containing protein n=1 Tax=Companilactobacillus baiquanensis TaxID=2486005 RepID=A0ABW1UUM1_9LACO|nr:hypothetical protein [Companilactobacillus baiquanensis]
MYDNQCFKTFCIMNHIKQSDIADLLEKSKSTVHRKNKDLGFTQKEIIILHDAYQIPFEVFFHKDESNEGSI